MSVGGLARRLLAPLRRTPLHPQWLLGDRRGLGRWLGRHSRGIVLDVGCADRWVHPWLDPACTYVGLDYPATGGLLYGARPDVFADAGRLPFADASVDTVILAEVLEHLREPAAALAEIRRVLRPGGVLLASMPFLYPVHDAPHDYQRYTRHGLAEAVERAGLRLSQVEPSLHAAASAGLIANLALSGCVLQGWRKRHAGILLAPLLLPLVPLINLFAWLCARLLADWPDLTAGHRFLATR